MDEAVEIVSLPLEGAEGVIIRVTKIETTTEEEGVGGAGMMILLVELNETGRNTTPMEVLGNKINLPDIITRTIVMAAVIQIADPVITGIITEVVIAEAGAVGHGVDEVGVIVVTEAATVAAAAVATNTHSPTMIS